MRSASFGSQCQRRFARTGIAAVPCAFADMMLSSPRMGSFCPGFSGAPTQPAERPSGGEEPPVPQVSDAMVLEGIEPAAPINGARAAAERRASAARSTRRATVRVSIFDFKVRTKRDDVTFVSILWGSRP